jgi:streptogramin lyase
MKRRVLSFVAAAALASCGSGATPSVAPAGAGTSPVASRVVKATIRISIPKRKRTHRLRIRGHYVSPASQSIAIVLTRSGGSPVNFNADLTPATNPNCISSSPLVCSLTFAVPPGSYTASFATYDGLLAGGNAPNNAPTGNLLSANQTVSFTLAAGRTNVINATLGGVPTSVIVTPAAGSTLTGNMSGFTAAKCGAQTDTTEKVSVVGLDADQNAIVGPGAPVPSIDSSDAAVLSASTPSPASPNLFTLTHPVSSSQQSATLTVKVTPSSDRGGGVVSQNVPVTISGGSQPCVTITKYLSPSTHPFPELITAGPDGNMWFAELCGQKIGKITPAGTITEYPVGQHTYGITSGPDGNLWFTSPQGYLGRSTTAGAITLYHNGGANFGIAAGTDNALWFADNFNDDIGRITTTGSISSFSAGIGATSGTYGITAGPDGNLWFTEIAGNKIGRITTAGVATEFSTGLHGTGVLNITNGPDGNLWFTECGAAIGRITPTGTITEFTAGILGQAESIVAGADGALWFPSGNNIARMTTAGSLALYPLSDAAASPTGIALAADGSLWFTETPTGEIGHIVVH